MLRLNLYMFLNLSFIQSFKQITDKDFFVKKLLPFLTLFLLYVSLFGQNSNIGIPTTINYTNQLYQAGTQNWDIGQHPNGFLFFCNNDGLLQFDGTNWRSFPLPNKTIARSLHIHSSQKIYVGGQGEFGFFEPNAYGQLFFHSLLDLIPEADRQFSDVWELVHFDDRIYFNASDKIYELKNDYVNVYTQGKIKFIGKGNGQLFVGNENGLCTLKDGTISPVNGGNQLAEKIIVDVVQREKGKLIFATQKSGLYELNQGILTSKIHEDTNYIKSNEIYCAKALDKDRLALGLVGKGLFILNKAGKVLYHLNKRNGLQNNNIHSLYEDKNHNLWLGLNNGIDQVLTNSPFTKIIPDIEQEGTAYTASIFKDKLYLGTSNGLYQQDWQPYYHPLHQNNFQLVKGSEGQVWELNQIDQQFFMNHHNGGFLFQPDQQLKKITPFDGNWAFLPVKNHPDYLISGTYEGLALYQKNGDHWTFVKKYNEITESCRIIVQDELNSIWIAHPYRGLYKVQLTDDLMNLNVQFYDKKEGFPCENLSTVNEEIIFSGETGIFYYDAIRDTFIHNNALENLIGQKEKIQGLFEDAVGNIWYRTATETGVLKVKDKGLSKSISKETYPTIHNKMVRGFEFIYPYDAHNVFIGAEKGFIHFNPSKENKKQPYFFANIVRVEAIRSNNRDSSLLFGQYQSTDSKASTIFPNDLNAFRFSYTSPNFPTNQKRYYRTQLEGFDNQWSDWGAQTTKEYTNLKAGEYRFLVQAKLNPAQESKIASYTFQIHPPWYASTLAISLYALLVLLFLISLIFIPRKRFQQKLATISSEKANLESKHALKEKEHQQAVAKNEKEISSLKDKNLETEIIHKNRELALTTMHLVQRNQLIHKLQEPLAQVLRKTTDKTAITEIKRINKLLQENAKMEDSWSQFANHFDQVHINFLQRLREEYPQLTSNDRKLCAYLRMNLTTKEIAPLMNISIRGVEVGRYRLRKKIGLESNVNLTEFMMSI